MKQTKRLLAVLLVGVCALAVGCGSSAATTESPASSDAAVTSESPASSDAATTESPAADASASTDTSASPAA